MSVDNKFQHLCCVEDTRLKIADRLTFGFSFPLPQARFRSKRTFVSNRFFELSDVSPFVVRVFEI